MSITVKMREQVEKTALISMLRVLEEEELANGSDFLADEIAKYIADPRATHSPKEVGSFIYKIYTDYMEDNFVLKDDAGDE